MSQFEHESPDQSAAANELVREQRAAIAAANSRMCRLTGLGANMSLHPAEEFTIGAILVLSLPLHVVVVVIGWMAGAVWVTLQESFNQGAAMWRKHWE